MTIRNFYKWLPIILFVCLCVVGLSALQAQDGRALFQQKCASCHGIDRDLTGPALKGMLDKVGGDKKLLFDWIRNNQKVLASGNKYFNDLYVKWNKAQMNLFPDLTDEELEAINTYVETWQPPVKKEVAAKSSDSNYEFFVWIIVGLVGLVLLLLNLNKNLRRVSDEIVGLGKIPQVPFYRKKVNIIIVTIIVIGFVTYKITGALMDLGRDQNYQPKQPIFYSHKVHAGINKIKCLFCHTNASKGHYASVPSLSTCMTCHMGITEYKGETLYDKEGEAIDGTAEIQKLYDYVGWNAQEKKYDKPAKPIEWIRLHVLPDHVFFSHDNHVVNGKLKCQQCHGPVPEMDELRQYADLSMGWCVNCHRNTNVQFESNNYYSMFEKLHKDLKSGKIKAVNPEMIGANECQKCHY